MDVPSLAVTAAEVASALAAAVVRRQRRHGLSAGFAFRLRAKREPGCEAYSGSWLRET